MTVRARIAVVATAAALVLTGCSGTGEPEKDPAETLAAAKRQLDETSGVGVGLSTESLPPGVEGLLSARGVGNHDPAFEGDIKVATGGITADVQVVAVDGKVYAKLPFTTKFTPIDPADYGAPDPAALLEVDGGLSSLLAEARDVEQGKQVRDGETVLTSFSGSVPGRSVAAIIPSASATEDFDATFTVDDEQRLAKAVLTGPFYPEADDVTYAITFEDYGTKATITAPRPGQ